MLRTVVLLCLLVVYLPAASISPLYFFGDSLSDTGNVYAGTSLLNTLTLGAFPVTPSAPYSNGRFSNGPVWTETVASRLGRPNDAKAAGMSLGPVGSLPGAGGNNYAIGGARTGAGGALGPLDSLIPTGMLAQTNHYLSTRTVDPNGLYFLLGGGNDLRDGSLLTDQQTQISAMSNAALYLAYSIYALYDAGARNFVLMNGPNIGFIPESLAAGRMETGILASLYFNYFLSGYADYLSTTLPGIQIQRFDLYSWYNDIVFDAVSGGAKYGFTSITPCIDNLAACDSTVFFDDIHPTSRVHTLLGNTLADQLLGIGQTSLSSLSATAAPVPEPATTGTVVLAVAVGALVRRRRQARIAA